MPPKLSPDGKPSRWEAIFLVGFTSSTLAAFEGTFMASPMTLQIHDVLLRTTGKHYLHVPALAGRACVQSGDPLSRGARRHSGCVQRVREVSQLVGTSYLA